MLILFDIDMTLLKTNGAGRRASAVASARATLEKRRAAKAEAEAAAARAAEEAARPTYELVQMPTPSELKAAANDKKLLKAFPNAATPDLCCHVPSAEAPDTCLACGYAIRLVGSAGEAEAEEDDDDN